MEEANRTGVGLLDRLAALYGLGDELAPLRALDGTIAIEPLEASVSLGAEARDLRLTLGLPTHAELRTLIESLGVGTSAGPGISALALAARGARERRYAGGAALRARPGRAVRPRPATWLGGDTIPERTARVSDALAFVGLDEPARTSERLAGILGSNPFSAVVPYGLALDLGRDEAAGAKVYYSCESAEVVLGHLHGPIADELRLGDQTGAFDALAEVTGADWRRARWLLEASFELPGDASARPRAKLYAPPASLGTSELAAHRAILRLAAELGLDAAPYEALIRELRPDGLSPDRPPMVMVGVSVTAQAISLEAYVFVHSLHRRRHS